MEHPPEAQRVDRPELHRNRIKPLAAVEFLVLERVNDVKTGHPEQHDQTIKHRQQRPLGGYRQVGSDRRQGQPETEHEVAQKGEPLGVAVPQNNGQCDRTKQQSKRIQQAGAEHEESAVKQNENQRRALGNYSGRNFPNCSSWILPVNIPVKIAVEGHGRRAGEDHAEQHQRQFAYRKLPVVQHRQEEAQQRKGQGEDGVAEFDQREEVDDSGQGGNFQFLLKHGWVGLVVEFLNWGTS